MEISIRRNIKDILQPLKSKTIHYTAGALVGVGTALGSPISESRQEPLEVYINCNNSTPVIEIIGNIVVAQGINWLVAEEVGSRRFRVLEKSGTTKKWQFREEYVGSADPRSKYTEMPVGKFYFHKGKEYDFSVYSGRYSSRGTPLLDQRQHRIRQKIPSC